VIVPDLRSFPSYDDAVASFRWDVPERLNAYDLFGAHAGGAAVALYSVGPGGELDVATFTAVDRATERLAAAFRAAGLARGSRVATALPNNVECAAVQLAAIRAGCVVAGLRLHPDPEAYRHELRAVGPDLVVSESDRVGVLRERTPPGTRFVVADPGAWHAWAAGREPGPAPEAAAAFAQLDELLAAGGPDGSVEATAADDPVYIAFTSGSTGAPKAVVQSHRSMLMSIPNFQLWSDLGPRPGDVFFSSLGWSTSAGIRAQVIPVWSFGRPMVSTTVPLGPREYCDVLTSLRVTVAYLMPNVLRELRQLGDAVDEYDWRDLRAITYAGEALGAELQRWLEERLGASVNPYYGASEVAFLASACRAWFDTPPDSVGKRVPGRDVAVIDEETLQPLPTGSVGILSVHRSDPGVCLGYRSPDTGELDFGTGATTDEWFLTNDLGRIDPDGLVRYVGRRGQVIQTRDGRLVPPTDVEDAVLGMAGIGEVIALQLDEAAPESLTVCVTLRDDGADTAAPDIASAVRDAVERRFAGELQVARVVALADVPRTAGTAKINRRVLRDSLLAGDASIVADVALT
jgi:acetyl-CoA synthetase